MGAMIHTHLEWPGKGGAVSIGQVPSLPGRETYILQHGQRCPRAIGSSMAPCTYRRALGHVRPGRSRTNAGLDRELLRGSLTQGGPG